MPDLPVCRETGILELIFDVEFSVGTDQSRKS